SELRALRAQINPHFLFNALNTIRYFVRIDPEAARSLLLSLSEVFQRALRAGEFVQLRSEISYVEAYLSLEKARLDKRLRVVWVVQGVEGQVQDSPLFEYTVPTLILQPIVENAIIHGVAKKPEGGIVRIGIDQADGHLLLQVSDTGVGMSPERITEILGPDQSKTSSIGLRNVDRRLRVLYGEEFRIEIQSEPKRGTWVQIKLPLETRQAGSFELRGRFDSLPKFRVTEPKMKL
ncbi:MAG TPA: histidine kinase, partial [Acidobacteriota bacterium]|nr:histidine kinase [Acidobacteriota bacterium]